jgi:hypothetical protein
MSPFILDPTLLTVETVVGITAAALIFFLLGRYWHSHAGRRRLPERWPLVPRPVLSAAEQQAFEQLQAAFSHELVLVKLPLVRFCQPLDTQRSRHWYELIGACYVTFAICSKEGRVLLALDLEYKTHRQMPSERTEKIKSSVLAACKIRHVKFSAERLPTAQELTKLLKHSQSSAQRKQKNQENHAIGESMRRASASLVQTLRSRRETRPWGADSQFAADSFFAPLPSSFGEFQPTGTSAFSEQLSTRSAALDAASTQPFEPEADDNHVSPSSSNPYHPSKFPKN